MKLLFEWIFLIAASFVSSNSIANVNEGRARVLAENLSSTPNNDDLKELLNLVLQNEWQDLELLEKCIRAIRENLTAKSIDANVTSMILERILDQHVRITSAIGAPFTAADVIRLTTLHYYNHDLIAHVLLNTDCNEEARLMALRKFKGHLYNGKRPSLSVLPGPDSTDPTFHGEWLEYARILVNSSEMAPQWKVMGMIHLMGDLDISPEVRKEAKEIIADWKKLESNRPKLDAGFVRILDQTLSDYRKHAPTFISSMKSALHARGYLLQSNYLSHENFRRSKACQVAFNFRYLPNRFPNYLDYRRLPQFWRVNN